MEKYNKKTIQSIAEREKISLAEATIYFDLFNNVSITEKDMSEELGRKMYLKFAKRIAGAECFMGVGDSGEKGDKFD